ncbi:Probable serine/threonine-protein kinase At1g01540 [Linum perenne]
MDIQTSSGLNDKIPEKPLAIPYSSNSLDSQTGLSSILEILVSLTLMQEALCYRLISLYSIGNLTNGVTVIDQVNLVEWLKTMVTNQKADEVLDPRLPEKPSSRALKRALLVALR